MRRKSDGIVAENSCDEIIEERGQPKEADAQHAVQGFLGPAQLFRQGDGGCDRESKVKRPDPENPPNVETSYGDSPATALFLEENHGQLLQHRPVRRENYPSHLPQSVRRVGGDPDK